MGAEKPKKWSGIVAKATCGGCGRREVPCRFHRPSGALFCSFCEVKR